MNHSNTDTIPFQPEPQIETTEPQSEEPITTQIEDLIEQGELDLLDILDRAFATERTENDIITIPKKETF